MGSPAPVKLPGWLGALPISHPKALLCAPMLLPFRRGCSDPSGFLRLGSPASTPSPGEPHSCRSVSTMAGLYPPVWCSMSPFPQQWMGRVCSEKNTGVVPSLCGFFPLFPHV